MGARHPLPYAFAKANTLLASLSSLVGQRPVEYVIGADGNTAATPSEPNGRPRAADGDG